MARKSTVNEKRTHGQLIEANLNIFLKLELPIYSQLGTPRRFDAINSATWKVKGVLVNPRAELRLSEHELSRLAHEYDDII